VGDLKSLEQEGSAFLIGIEEGTPGLPLDDALQDRPFVGMQSQATRTSGGARVIFPALTHDVMQRLATHYFDTFNLLYPLLDRQTFLSVTVTIVHTDVFDGDTDSVFALLVFALGELSIEGSCGNPIEIHKGRPSGIRGGTATRPPGLALFNEARKRIGFVLTECEIENVQIFSLAAYVISLYRQPRVVNTEAHLSAGRLYYQSCFHHVVSEFHYLQGKGSLGTHAPQSGFLENGRVSVSGL
jgi:hypothetical protein